MGFEATTIYSEEAHNPERTVPRATYLAVLIIGLFYAFTSWCMVNGTGADKLMKTLQGLSDPTTFIFTLSSKYTGSMATTVMELLLVSSVFAALLAFHNAAARYFYVLGREASPQPPAQGALGAVDHGLVLEAAHLGKAGGEQ